jgi:hypothetical protein
VNNLDYDFDVEDLNRPAQLRKPRWDPVRWHPVYEEVVMMDAMGYPNIEIAKLKGFMKEHISNILCSEKGRALKQIIIDRQRTTGLRTFEDRLERAADKAMQRVEAVLDNDEYAEKNPGGIFDRALKMLQATKKVAKDADAPTTNIIMVPAGAVASLKEAVTRSEQVREMHTLAAGIEVVTTR